MTRAGALLILLLGTACGQEGPPPTRLACHSREVNIAFWPEGHGPIPSINAPEARVPHVEVSVQNNSREFRVSSPCDCCSTQHSGVGSYGADVRRGLLGDADPGWELGDTHEE
jgi:hypothetical protein